MLKQVQLFTSTLIIMFFCLLLSTETFAQIELDDNQSSESKAVILTLNDGSVVYGYLSARSDDQVTVTSVSLGSLIIPISEIQGITYVDVKNLETDKNGIFLDYHNSTRNFVFPTGYNLRKGQSYYENIYVFLNSFSYGVTNNITVTGSFELASLLFASDTPLMFLSAKFGVPIANEKAAFAISTSYLFIPNDQGSNLVFVTGSFTLGSRNNNVTLGVGAGINFSNGLNDEVVPLSLSTMQRVSNKISLISENWIFIEDDFGNTSGILSAGIRIHFKDNKGAFNVGLYRPLRDDGFGFIAAPLVSAAITIGR